MNKLKNIIVGVDFSAGSQSALHQAVRVARWNGARLHVLHGIEYLVLKDEAEAVHRPYEKLEDEARVEARRMLTDWMAAAGAPDEAEVYVEVGSPIDLLLRRVKETGADLLVLGVKGLSEDVTGTGTLAIKALRKMPGKVLLVDEGDVGAFCSVVACVDFSETSREVVAQTLRVASQDQSRVHFLHVVSPPGRRFGFRTGSPRESIEHAGRDQTRLRSRLKDFVGDVGTVPVSYDLVQGGSHGHAIAEFCRAVDAKLIVLGRRGKTDLQYVLLGSTAERLVRELPTSLLVVQPAPTAGPGHNRELA